MSSLREERGQLCKPETDVHTTAPLAVRVAAKSAESVWDIGGRVTHPS